MRCHGRRQSLLSKRRDCGHSSPGGHLLFKRLPLTVPPRLPISLPLLLLNLQGDSTSHSLATVYQIVYPTIQLVDNAAVLNSEAAAAAMPACSGFAFARAQTLTLQRCPDAVT